MGLLIRNGEIVTVGSRTKADIYAENETITRIGKNLGVPPGTEIIDATGKFVFPGFIDPHVHIYLPFMATFAKDTHETASIAALIGGTTTYIEMCCPNRTDDALAGYELWKSKANGKSACDYAFHMSVTKFGEETESQLREVVADGTSSFKIFLAYKHFFGVDDGEMYQTLTLAKKLGVIVTAHCENAELVARLLYLAFGRLGAGTLGGDLTSGESDLRLESGHLSARLAQLQFIWHWINDEERRTLCNILIIGHEDLHNTSTDLRGHRCAVGKDARIVRARAPIDREDDEKP